MSFGYVVRGTLWFGQIIVTFLENRSLKVEFNIQDQRQPKYLAEEIP